mgnify:CR=1 FL=1
MAMNTSHKGIYVLFIFHFFFHFIAFGQVPQFNEADLVKLAGEKKAVVINHSEKVSIEFYKGKPEIYIEYDEHILYLNEQGIVGNERIIPYSDRFFSLDKLEACTWIPDGKSYRKIKASETEHFSNISSGLFYDDMMQAKIMFQGLENRAVSELKYRYHIKDPLYAIPFYFNTGYSIPVSESKISIICPENIDLEIRMFGDTSKVISSIEKSKGSVIFTKLMNNILPEKEYENETSRAYYSPHLFYILKSYKSKGSTITISGTVDELYKNNFVFIKDLNKEPISKGIVSLVDSLKSTVPQNDSLALIEKIYYWVQQHIRYIAIEDGLGGFYPRPSNAVFERHYGDCKDKAALLQTLFKQANISSYLTWVGTRDIPYTYKELPLLSSSNHMILSKKIGDEWMFFDATSENLPIYYPSSFIQGKEAMISIDADHFEIAKIPEINVDLNAISDTLSMHFNSMNLIEINGKINFSGFARWRFMSSYNGLNEKDKKDYIHSFLKHNYSKSKIIDYSVSGNLDIHQPISIQYRVELPDYATKIDSNFYLNLFLMKPMMNEQVKETNRLVPISYAFQYTNSLDVKFELPKGYKTPDLPISQEFSSDLISFKRTYNESDSIIHLSSILKVNSMFIEPNRFNDWNKGINVLNKVYKESISILPKK